MQDRFKFRGQTKSGKWIYGSLLWYADEPQIWDKNGWNFIVKNKTVSQCTGIADKNGKLIYEGDILKNLLNGKKYKVAWVGCQASFELHQILSPNDEDYKKAQPIAIYFANGSFKRFQVLGNIYENPELLEE